MPEFKVGDRVEINGCRFDFTDHLDGKLGTIIAVREYDCEVEVDDSPSVFGGWMIWKGNLAYA